MSFTDSEQRPVLRYTVEVLLEPNGRGETFHVVTSLGELKAAAIAAIHLTRSQPASQLGAIEIVEVESEFQIDPDSDLLDYWGGVD